MSQNKSTLVPIPDEVGNFYDRLALNAAVTAVDNNLHFGYWDDPDSEAPFDEAVNRLTDIMAEKLEIGSGSHVLDVGCGVGGPGVRIARITGARMTGISVSREQVALANSLAESSGLAERVIFQWANAMELPFPAQSFDAAIALESIIHIPDRGQVLTQICQTLKPGGRLVLTDFFERAPIPAAKQPTVDRFLNNTMSTLGTAEAYPPLLRHVGLRFEEIQDISEHTVPKSFFWMSKKFNQARLELAAAFGDEIVGRLDLLPLTSMIDIPEFGYLMVVAKRPKA
jgi:O-methyltransferase StaMB